MPQVIAIAIVKIAAVVGVTLTTTGTLVALASQVIFAAIVAGIRASQAPDNSQNFGGETRLQAQSDVSRVLLCGERGIAGSRVYHKVSDEDRDVLHLVYALADHPVTACKEIYMNGILVNNGQPLEHGIQTQINEFNNGDQGRCWITFYDGRPGQVANASLVTNTEGEWSEDARGAGVCYIYMKLIFDTEVMATVPSVLTILQGAPFYDRRKDTTAGGDGPHRLNDPLTWEYTKNPMVILDHYLLGYQVELDPVAFGVGLSVDDLAYEVFAETADLCDEVVTYSDGTSSLRHEANGLIYSASFFEDVLEQLQIQMSARIADLGGRIGILGSEPKLPVVDLSDQDLTDSDTFVYTDRRSFADLVGGVEGRYAEPAHFFEPTEYQKVLLEDTALPDGGELGIKTLNLPFETNAKNAARTAKVYVDREQNEAILAGTFDRTAWPLEPGDWFTYSSDLEQLDHALFEVIDCVHHDDFTVTLTAQATTPDVNDFSQHEDPELPNISISGSVVKRLDIPSVSFLDVVLENAFFRGPAVRIDVHNQDERASHLVVELQPVHENDTDTYQGSIQVFEKAPIVFVRSNLVPGGKYRARVKSRFRDVSSNWSDWSNVIELSGDFHVPSAGIADGIVDQGWGATAPQSRIDNNFILDSVSSRVDKAIAAGFRMDGFSILGCLGDITFEANVNGASNIAITEGYIDHKILGKLEIPATQFATPWGKLFAPERGRFYIIYSEEPTFDRFSNNAGSGHFFPATFDGSRWAAWKLDRKIGEEFEPRVTDIVLAEAIKEGKEEDPSFSILDGVSEINSFVTDTAVADLRIETVESVIGSPNDGASQNGSIFGRIKSVSSTLASSTLSLANQINSVQTSVDGVSNLVQQQSTSISDIDSAFGSYRTSTNSRLDGVESDTEALQQSHVGIDSAFSSYKTSTNSRLDGVESDTEALQQSYAGIDSAFSSYKTSTNSRLDGVESDTEALQQSYAGIDSALSTLSHNTNVRFTGIETNTTSLQQSYADLDGAFSQFSQSVNASIGDFEISIDQALQVSADVSGRLMGSAHTILNNQNRISGWRLYDDGEESELAFMADAVRIFDGVNERPLLTASNGVVKMHNVEVNTIEANTVTTDNLVDNSVSQRVTVSDNSIRSTPSDASYFQIESFSHNKIKAASDIQVGIVYDHDKLSTENDFGLSIAIKRNGSVMKQFHYLRKGLFWHTENPQITFHNIPAGLSTWSVEVRASVSGSGVNQHRTIASQVTIEEKKK